MNENGSDDTLALLVDGQRHEGWTDVEVVLSLEQVSGGFSISLTEKWLDGSGGLVGRPVDPGAACRVEIAGQVVIDGYIDTAAVSIDGDGHTLSVQGRDKTADLVDSAAVHEPDEWRGETLEDIAARLAEPFGVTVTAKADTGAAFDDPNPFKIQQGETAFDAIDRACRLRGIIPVPDGKGGLLLTRGEPTGAAEALVEGENIEAATSSEDMSQRFSKYIVKGQSAGSDDFYGEAAAGAKAEAEDKGVKRYRPSLVIAEVAASDLQVRADWEANIRAARSKTWEFVLSSWTQRDGALWLPNLSAPVRAPSLGVDRELLIVEVRFRKDPEEGTHAVLKMMAKDAFKPSPPEVENDDG